MEDSPKSQASVKNALRSSINAFAEFRDVLLFTQGPTRRQRAILGQEEVLARQLFHKLKPPVDSRLRGPEDQHSVARHVVQAPAKQF